MSNVLSIVPALQPTRRRPRQPRRVLPVVDPTTLTDEQLIARVLGDASAAGALLHQHGGLLEVERLSTRELAAVPGIGAARAGALQAAITLGRRAARTALDRGAVFKTSLDITRYYAPTLGAVTTEVFHALVLDARHRRIRDVRVSAGTVSSCPVRPAEAFAAAVREAARAVVFVHNHPSGDPLPSQEDKALTARLAESGAVLGVDVLDHVIICQGGGFYSFADEGLL